MQKLNILIGIIGAGLLLLTALGGCEEVADLSIDPIDTPREFTFEPEVGYPGTVVVISGENLDGVEKVAFGTAEAEIVSASGTEIKVEVPVKAITDKIHLTFDKKVYSSVTNFMVTNVPVPEITGFSPVEVSRGDNVTITGTLLDQVKRVAIGDLEADIVSQAAGEIVVTAPAEFTTASIYLYYDYTTTYGMVKETSAVSAAELGLLLPSIASVEPGLSNLNIGDEITINGSSLNLVNAIHFGDVVVGEEDFTYAEGVITVAVPEGATSGTLTLEATDGTYEHESGFSVALPQIDSFTPQKGSPTPDTSRPFSVLGSKLDLVDSVKVGAEMAEIISHSESQILFSVSGTTNGFITLYTSNGEVSTSAPFAFVGDFWVSDWDTEFEVSRFSSFQNNGFGEYAEAVVDDGTGNNYVEFTLGGDLNGKSVYMWGAETGDNDRFRLYVSNPEGVYLEFDMKVPSIDEDLTQDDGTLMFKIFMMDALGWGASGEYTYGYNSATSFVQTDGEWQHFKLHLADFVASNNSGLYTAEQVEGTEGAFCHPNSLRIITYVFGVTSEDGKGNMVVGLDNVKFVIE